MSVGDIARRLLPEAMYESISRTKKRLDRARYSRLPPLTERDFTSILVNDLRLTTGDVVFVHSSTDQLHLEFPFYRILSLLREAIGPRGTLLFPSYPNHRISSY